MNPAFFAEHAIHLHVPAGAFGHGWEGAVLALEHWGGRQQVCSSAAVSYSLSPSLRLAKPPK